MRDAWLEVPPDQVLLSSVVRAELGPNDLMIAATALACDATLATRNDREFRRVTGLRVEVW